MAFHHTATRSEFYVDVIQAAERINAHHLEKGWDGGIGYVLIYHPPTRKAALCGELNSIRAHVYGKNHLYIGVAVVEDYTYRMPDQDTINDMQWLIGWVRREAGRQLEVVGHREITLPGWGTHCPTLNWYKDGVLILH